MDQFTNLEQDLAWNQYFHFDSYATSSIFSGDGQFQDPNMTLPSSEGRDDTPSSWETTSSSFAEAQYAAPPEAPSNQLKRRHPSEDSNSSNSSNSSAIVLARKVRKLRDPSETAKVREKGACFLCQTMRKECQEGDDPDGPCRRCLDRGEKQCAARGVIRPLCWRPNLGGAEMFRRGPTMEFAASTRGNRKDVGPAKQALWKHFAIQSSGREPPKIVELSQGWTNSKLCIRLDVYQPKDTDKQYYTWFDDGVEKKFATPAYGIDRLDVAGSTIEKFLHQNFDAYIISNLHGATEVTRRTFQTAQDHKQHFPLVERALKLWVGCRFIEEPWSITGSETLGMKQDANPNCPYHDKIPVPPIVDLQIDLIVINEVLQPELKKILKTMKTMLESSDAWNNWFEIYLTYFILLHNIELTMAHDAWFVKRNNLKTKYSNKPLVDTILQGANTLLTCFHYAHQGFAPFSNPALEDAQQWPEDQKAYLQEVRPMLERVRGDHVNDPAKELFWTSQLHKPDWRPIILLT